MNKKILVAEDDDAIREVIEIILTEAKYAVFTAKTSSEIFELVQKHTFNLLLLDIWLNGENGGEIAIELKRNPTMQQLPIVMISANSEIEKVAKDAGAVGFISKPFNIDDLLAVVKKHSNSSSV